MTLPKIYNRLAEPGVHVIALLQRVNWAKVNIAQTLHAEIGKGLLVFVGIEKSDTEQLAEKLLDKILSLRIFSDADGKMNLDVGDVAGDLMLVSQFTLAASTDKGLRPGFSAAMPPVEAQQLYEFLVQAASARHSVVRSGRFAADMQIALENDGPVTFILRT